MNSNQTFQEQSYKLHMDHFSRCYTKNEETLERLLNDSSVDGWRHERMRQVVEPLIEAEKEAKWLTVGDGRFGTDANYLLKKGIDVHASDINEDLLQAAHEAGYLSKYSGENAEALSFENDYFDYTMCKEAYHHFSRPMVALYEMIRVSRKGVCLIEPNDIYIEAGCLARAFWKLKNIIKSILGKPTNKKHNFEEVGNYLYCISKREIEKVAMGLNLKYVAFKYFNDVYLPGAGAEPLSDNGPFLHKFKRLVAMVDFLCKLGFMQYNFIGIALFKEEPSKLLKTKLKAEGFDLVVLPENLFSK